MKTLIVPTDFSTPAENAMLYAGQIANAINASVLLLHVYQVPVGMNDMPVLMVSAEELKNNADTGLERAKEILQSTFNGIDVKTESRLGDVVEELKDICKKENPLAIVAGKHGATGFERVLFGSTSLSIIRHLHYPVIVVSDAVQGQSVKNIALAIDGSGKLPVQKIRSVVDSLQAKLHIVHVQQGKTEAPNLNELVKELNSSCTTIRDDEFVHGIESFIQKNNIDLLMVLPHKHNLIERLFLRTHTPELLHKVSIPIMCINED